MIIVKSFWRKKSTKIYFLIFIFLFVIFYILIFSRKYFIQLDNTNYRGSFLSLKVEENEMQNISNSFNIKKITPGIKTFLNSYEIIFVASNKIKNETQIIIPKIYKDEIEIGSSLEYENWFLTIQDYYDAPTYSNIFLISPKIFEQLKRKQEQIFLVDLKVWAYQNKTIKILEQSQQVSDITSYIKKIDDINYDYIITAFRFFSLFLFIIFIIIAFITFINNIEDEKKNNLLYKFLGFSKLKRIKIIIVKLSSLVGISMVSNTILYFIFLIIYEFFK